MDGCVDWIGAGGFAALGSPAYGESGLCGWIRGDAVGIMPWLSRKLIDVLPWIISAFCGVRYTALPPQSTQRYKDAISDIFSNCVSAETDVKGE